MKRIRIALIGLVLVIAAGSLVFHYVEGRDLFTSAYFIMVTLTTVGFGDVVPLTPAGKLAALVTIVVGVVLLGLLVGTFVVSMFIPLVHLIQSLSSSW